ncbi:terpene synthase family protein [Streptomyces sp. RFCAC02]|uniref:terpene synthase family protein n=1 Tax=Streptomyces sp. RFCAC02 TaxID=2499143 RepID=UPI00101E910A|nr:terpene synthase family protein [Streptomyces sp. RFCAC02]
MRKSSTCGVMDFGEYLAHRRDGVNELIFHHLAEYVHDIELPASVRNLPAMAQARARASEWIGLYNDIHSAPEEAAVDYLHNAVLIVREHRGCSLQEAADAVAGVADGLMAQFDAAADSVPEQLHALPGGTPDRTLKSAPDQHRWTGPSASARCSRVPREAASGHVPWAIRGIGHSFPSSHRQT